MLRLKGIFKNYAETGSFNEQVNLYGFTDEHVFLTKTGDLGVILEVRGVDYECLDNASIDGLTKRLESALRLFDESYRVYQYLFKRNNPSIPYKLYGNPIVDTAIQNRIAYLQATRTRGEGSGGILSLQPVGRFIPAPSHSRRTRVDRRNSLPMNIAQVHLDALQALGYTETEARFLYIVATHSGYFTARQFLAFTDSHWGKRTTIFWDKLHSKKHARTEFFPKSGTVYHLFSRRLYRQIARENLRNRREHEFEYIQRRIGMLDFVLCHPHLKYLETEPDKVSYFINQLKVPIHFLPAKIYHGQRTTQPTVRYFVDKFPLFVGSDASSSLPVVTFTYPRKLSQTGSRTLHKLRIAEWRRPSISRY